MTNNKYINIFKHSLVLIIILFSFIFCSSNELRVSEFNFSYNNLDYKIRSAYCHGNPESCNQLIGNNFIAVDMNQDRIIDKISSGSISLAQAQTIYDYCLGLLEQKNLLNEVGEKENVYSFSDFNYKYEVRTFYPKVNSLFNEFSITHILSGENNSTSILIDHTADGKLDDILKGKIDLQDAQKHYKKVIEEGIASNDLVWIKNSIVLK